jgi:hypothetical protein
VSHLYPFLFFVLLYYSRPSYLYWQRCQLPQCLAAMVSLSYTVLFSLVVSLVVASHKGQGSMRKRHVQAGCKAGGSQVSTSGLPTQSNALLADASKPPTHTSGLPTQTSGLPTQASGKPSQTSNSTQPSSQPTPTGGKYQLVDHYQGQDFMNEA